MVEFNPKAKRERVQTRVEEKLAMYKAQAAAANATFYTTVQYYTKYSAASPNINWNIEDDGKYEF